MKEDIKILEKPRILNAHRAAILAQIAAIVLLLRRAFKFVVKTTILFTKLHQTDDPAIKDKLKPPSIPKSILNLIQLEWATLIASEFLLPNSLPGIAVLFFRYISALYS